MKAISFAIFMRFFPRYVCCSVLSGRCRGLIARERTGPIAAPFVKSDDRRDPRIPYKFQEEFLTMMRSGAIAIKVLGF